MRIAIFIFLAFSLLGCTYSKRRLATHAASTAWKIGDFEVRFQPGPQGEEGKSYSHYQISYRVAGQQERELVLESAHTLQGFESVTNGDPKNWIRIVQDPRGRALLIEEDIPNECGPCSNYLWVYLEADGFIEGTYLRLPSKVTGPHGGINYEYPKVRSLDGNILIYGYTVGDAITKQIDQIEKAASPLPPG
jgi:hypothetical protein